MLWPQPSSPKMLKHIHEHEHRNQNRPWEFRQQCHQIIVASLPHPLRPTELCLLKSTITFFIALYASLSISMTKCWTTWMIAATNRPCRFGVVSHHQIIVSSLPPPLQSTELRLHKFTIVYLIAPPVTVCKHELCLCQSKRIGECNCLWIFFTV